MANTSHIIVLILLAFCVTESSCFNPLQLRGQSSLIGAKQQLLSPKEQIVIKAPNRIDHSIGDFFDDNKRSLAVVAATLFAINQPAAAASLLDKVSESSGEQSGLVQSFLLIFISEIGDKTFFIAGLLAAKYGRLISFAGSIGALGVMTVISVILGQLFHAVPDSLTNGVPFDDYIAVAAFTYFGSKTLYDASQLKDDDNSGIEEEKEEAEKSVAELTADEKRKSTIAIFLQIFSLVFAAEIGDRSFLSTIALSAALNPFSVATGAIAAHASATGVAVVGGTILSKYLSEKVIGYIGGSLFLVFAITTALGFD